MRIQPQGLILRQLYLQFTLAGARTLGKNIQDQRRAVEHGMPGQLFQAAQLRGTSIRARNLA